MMRVARRASLLVAFSVLAGCVASAPTSQPDPIRLDTDDPRYSGYLRGVRESIKQKWAYPCVQDSASGRCDYKATSLVIEFGILRDGRVPFITVRRQSGYAIYDEYAVDAIRKAAPFAPVPPEFMTLPESGSRGIRIIATFTYIVEAAPKGGTP